MDLVNRLGGHDGVVHVVAYVVSTIGFLRAGVIMREEGNVRGRNTAATLSGLAAVGACAGADLLIVARPGACRTWSAESEHRPRRTQFLPDLQPNSRAIGQ